jgi:hypothetical protein
MRKLLNTLTISLTYAICSWAQSQVATVTAAAQFELRGANVTPGQGVPSWPVMSDDTIKAGSGSVTMAFGDGSTVILDPKSTAKVSISGQTPEFQLETGSAHYALKSTSGVKLIAMGKPVSPTHLSGFVKIGNGRVSTGWWSPAHTAVVAGGVAAASGVLASEATKGGSAVSPSH